MRAHDGITATKCHHVGLRARCPGGGIRGYELGVIAGALLFVTPALHLSPPLKGVVVGSALFGSMGGALLVGPISDRFGRPAMAAATAALYSIAALGTALSPTVVALIVFRIVLQEHRSARKAAAGCPHAAPVDRATPRRQQ